MLLILMFLIRDWIQKKHQNKRAFSRIFSCRLISLLILMCQRKIKKFKKHHNDKHGKEDVFFDVIPKENFAKIFRAFWSTLMVNCGRSDAQVHSLTSEMDSTHKTVYNEALIFWTSFETCLKVASWVDMVNIGLLGYVKKSIVHYW